MIRAWRPNLKDLKELFPQYKGDIFDSRGSFRFIHNWFEDERKESGGENIDSSSNVSFFFIGGDESGMCTGCCFWSVIVELFISYVHLLHGSSFRQNRCHLPLACSCIEYLIRWYQGVETGTARLSRTDRNERSSSSQTIGWTPYCSMRELYVYTNMWWFESSSWVICFFFHFHTHKLIRFNNLATKYSCLILGVIWRLTMALPLVQRTLGSYYDHELVRNAQEYWIQTTQFKLNGYRLVVLDKTLNNGYPDVLH